MRVGWRIIGLGSPLESPRFRSDPTESRELPRPLAKFHEHFRIASSRDNSCQIFTIIAFLTFARSLA